jgi:hypothetical protein
MKRLLLLSALLISSIIFAQVPQGISYQAIALNGSGNPVVSSNVGIRLSIINDTAAGAAVYSETHTKMTNAQGLFHLVIGQGTPVSGTFAAVNWGMNDKFLKVEMDAAGGSNYTLVGTTQLLSVPYALTAASLVTAPGQGIYLTSPNGTPHLLTVSNDGELSLPTSDAPANVPSQLFMYGTFNGWNPATALQFADWFDEGYFTGLKYMTAGSQVRFLGAQNSSLVYGGGSLNGVMIANGSPITIPSNGFYKFSVSKFDGTYQIQSINVLLKSTGSTEYTMSYNAAENYFYKQTVANGSFRFIIGNTFYGDNLGDGSLDINGAEVTVPGTNKTFKLYMNFNTTGDLVITYP